MGWAVHCREEIVKEVEVGVEEGVDASYWAGPCFSGRSGSAGVKGCRLPVLTGGCFSSQFECE